MDGAKIGENFPGETLLFVCVVESGHVDKKIPTAVIAVVANAIGYRYTHDQIDTFMESAGIEMATPPPGNRHVKTRRWLNHANETMPDPLGTLGKVITELMEVESPYDSEDVAQNREKVIGMLNAYNLSYMKGGLIVTAGATGVSSTLEQIIQSRDMSGLQTEFDRINQNIELDPAAAVTASCALLESLFKIYIEEVGLEMPPEQTVKPLWKVIRKDLKFDPALVEDDDLKSILGGLAAIVEGIGSLRTHKGSAQGRTKKYKIGSRHARLAAHSAFTLASFVLEAWDKRAH